jgi:PAS domain S-box-containing protein
MSRTQVENREDVDYRLVVDSTPALVFSARPDGYVDYFNQRWFDYFGVSLAALEGWGWTSFIHPDDREEQLRRWRTSIVDGQPAVSQSRVADAKGEYRWMLHRTEALCDEAGNVIRWFGTSIDIEELKRAQRELDELKERLYKENIALREELTQTSMFEEIGSLLPAQRLSDRGAAAARPSRRHPPACRVFDPSVCDESGEEDREREPKDNRSAHGLRLARQHPRAAERDPAGCHPLRRDLGGR